MRSGASLTATGELQSEYLEAALPVHGTVYLNLYYVNSVHGFDRCRCYKKNRTDKGIPAERQGRKATGLRGYPRTAGLPGRKTSYSSSGLTSRVIPPAQSLRICWRMMTGRAFLASNIRTNLVF